MVGSFGIVVKGIPKATAFLTARSKLIMRKAEEGIKDAGFFLQGEVKQSIAGRRAEVTSVDTGRFLNSIGVEFKKLQARIFPTVFYADHLEFGTSRMAPRRHFRNSLTRNKSKIASFIQSKIRGI